MALLSTIFHLFRRSAELLLTLSDCY